LFEADGAGDERFDDEAFPRRQDVPIIDSPIAKKTATQCDDRVGALNARLWECQKFVDLRFDFIG
jgi:hypothetical protein